MAYTVAPAPAINTYLQQTLTQKDFLGEPIVKGNLLYNAGNTGLNFQLAMRAYESLSQAAIVRAAVSQKYVVTGANGDPGSAGAFAKAGDVAILVFTRDHPVTEMAGTTLTNEFVIVAPHPDIFDTGTRELVITAGETFATATTRPEALGALIDWLETSLVVTILKTRYPGGWTFSASLSKLASLPKQYDGYSVS